MKQLHGLAALVFLATGCAVSRADEVATDGAELASESAVHDRCTAATGSARCAAGLACTYAADVTEGTCRKTGVEGGLCGGTYSDFAGGECATGLRCALGTASYPGAAGGPSTHPDTVGLCVSLGAIAEGGACTEAAATGSARCAAGLACTYAADATEGTCRKTGVEGGLCGGTYSDFAGGECATGLRCALGTASYPGAAGDPSTHPDTVGLCTK
jgi:hypothetical protein